MAAHSEEHRRISSIAHIFSQKITCRALIKIGVSVPADGDLTVDIFVKGESAVASIHLADSRTPLYEEISPFTARILSSPFRETEIVLDISVSESKDGDQLRIQTFRDAVLRAAE